MKQCFLDIDGTLLNQSYETNVSDFAERVQVFVKGDWRFHLNSNRSLEDMLPLYQQFGFNGWLICENGAFGYQPIEKKTQLLADTDSLELIQNEKRVLPARIQSIFQKLNLGSTTWLDVDTVNFLSSTDKVQAMLSVDVAYFCLNNCYRQYSASIHIRSSRIDNQQLSPEIGTQVAAELQSTYSLEQLPLRVTFSQTHRNLLINLTSVSKRTGVEWAQKSLAGKVLAIGDELSDYQMVSGLGTFYTTANAAERAKAVATATASQEYTAGVLELLQLLS